MNDKQLTAILILLVPQVIGEISMQEHISEKEAAVSFYRSEVYSVLEEERTKLWHLSPKALYELYKQERETGHIIYPEEA